MHPADHAARRISIICSGVRPSCASTFFMLGGASSYTSGDGGHSAAPIGIPRSDSVASSSSGSTGPSGVRQLQCSSPSTPARIASSTARSAWACAVTGIPAAWDDLDDQPQLVQGELRLHRVGARGGHATTGHHLDDVHPALDPLRHRRLDLRRPADLAAHVVAVAARGGQRWTGRQDGRLHGAAVADAGPLTVPAVHHRRTAGRPGPAPWSPPPPAARPTIGSSRRRPRRRCTPRPDPGAFGRRRRPDARGCRSARAARSRPDTRPPRRSARCPGARPRPRR